MWRAGWLGVLASVAFACGCLPPVEDATQNTPEAIQRKTMEDLKKAEEKRNAENQASANAAQAAPAAAGFTKTASGLQYKIVKPGTDHKPKSTETVRCHYRGTLDDGTEFDSSYKRNEPSEFALNQVIAGWTEGLQLIGEGGEIDLIIPSNLGYGAAGRPGIPPNATLHFKVELIDIL